MFANDGNDRSGPSWGLCSFSASHQRPEHGQGGKARSIYEIGAVDNGETICSILAASDTRALFVRIVAGGQERQVCGRRQKVPSKERYSAGDLAV
jgi:hypothetical protein